ncbi:hypothetical protein [Tumebacillus lipolyticus]|uniref:IS110 family transposase n=1 Tax=Tumebacillus lipolyticus TaxID=1280370 RepID=A0ABW5A3K2_9BACL
MKHRKERFIYVGVDLHKRTHTAVVINCWNEKLAVIPFENKPAAFPAMVEQVVCHVGGPKELNPYQYNIPLICLYAHENA